MRVFQSFCYYPSYRPRLRRLATNAATFRQQIEVFFADRYGASHILLPVIRADPDAFFTNWDDDDLQRAWAREAGMAKSASLEDILLAQIESHRTDIFYNIDPVRLENGFLARLPGCVKKTIAWRAAPSGNVDFSKYDLVVCNFPAILADLSQRGYRTAYFAPAHDPAMDPFADNSERPIDVIFVGGYSRHHLRRAEILNSVAGLADQFKIVFHLDASRLSRLAESPIGFLPPLARHRRPQDVRSVSKLPAFGLDLYYALSQAKIVLNGAIDMAGNDRGNMRCFEGMGCGALLLSDDGRYPDGMVPGNTLLTYDSATDAVAQIRRLLADHDQRRAIAREGHKMVSTRYSKEIQWLRFQELL
ncbi:glycosyltransferase [Bradyrhizobium sp. 44]|uniref:glycosyltransferase family protein n=1 Tax=Bradyrhizobium sp. 44 TaxID=2782675 RepID=UPI001FF8538D|nr:glycosyltransferase [Bradyrhizobium sp. 44]MCK1287623.1 glycosyltransferase [Bradyrhizobium sp. 44]